MTIAIQVLFAVVAMAGLMDQPSSVIDDDHVVAVVEDCGYDYVVMGVLLPSGAGESIVYSLERGEWGIEEALTLNDFWPGLETVNPPTADDIATFLQYGRYGVEILNGSIAPHSHSNADLALLRSAELVESDQCTCGAFPQTGGYYLEHEPDMGDYFFAEFSWPSGGFDLEQSVNTGVWYFGRWPVREMSSWYNLSCHSAINRAQRVFRDVLNGHPADSVRESYAQRGMAMSGAFYLLLQHAEQGKERSITYNSYLPFSR